MTIFKFSDALVCGNAELDQLRAEFFRFYGEYEASKSSSLTLLGKLSQIFALEEEILRSIEYPESLEHIAAHHELLDKFKSRASQLAEDSPQAQLHDVFHAIAGHFYQHIVSVDSLYISYL